MFLFQGAAFTMMIRNAVENDSFQEAMQVCVGLYTRIANKIVLLFKYS